ncbi:hypothetical protein D9757_011705 [Collybiopsis confluens]|uniref:Major facilitator superfamily (MFS) profile domain-containing protein n=1 Tax=Collybiopsis confluens TaxID=2823264 RepID=A0A8H5GMB3_9AGAR|nr:hypothetical protein D9757_011705 [Collybiopsis confluens]
MVVGKCLWLEWNQHRNSLVKVLNITSISGFHYVFDSLPVGLGMFLALPLAGGMQKILRIKWVILLAQLGMLAGTILLVWANAKDHYWFFALLGFLLGSMGAFLIYATANVALIIVTPPNVSGIVSAIFNASMQTGGAVRIAIITSIQTSVDNHRGEPNSFSGRAAGLEFLASFVGVMTILFIVFFQDTVGLIANLPESGELGENTAPSADAFGL